MIKCDGGILKSIAIVIFAAIFFALASLSVEAQSDYEKSKNLTSCLGGKYPSLCKQNWLSSEESLKVEAAQRRENLKTCLQGRYPSLCKKSKLSPDELQLVLAAEKRENLRICLTGRYTVLCKRQLLTESELKQVMAAEQSENLRNCLTGRYPSLCNKSFLSNEQLSATITAEKRSSEELKRFAGKATTTRNRQNSTSGCESGHWIDSVSNDGEIVKLEDGSIWKVDSIDTIDSSLWLPITDIVVCNGKLINTDDNESVSARRIR